MTGRRVLAVAVGLAILGGIGCGARAPRVHAQGEEVRVAERATHPLDPLTPGEILAGAAVLRSQPWWSEGSRVVQLSLAEPSKDTLAKWRSGDPIERRAFAIVYDRASRTARELIIALDPAAVETARVVEGVQPSTLDEEYEMLGQICRADEGWQAAMRKRGFKDEELDGILVDGWAPGSIPIPEAKPNTRVMVALMYVVGDQKNAYARPIEGVLAVIDLNERKVLRLEDTGVMPIRTRVEDYEGDHVGAPRAALKPLRISQPEGHSFTVDGNAVQWDRWKLRYTLHPREGLVLHQVVYIDGDTERPVLHRASLSEMAVPYGDPDPTWSWRSAFDMGEYQMGALASHLVPNEDAPENALLLDAVMADQNGELAEYPGAVAIYERDGGMLWRHYDYVNERTVSRRGRQLVLRYTTTIGNYDYGFSWVLGQDGSIAKEVELTGILLPKSIRALTCPSCGSSTSSGTMTPDPELEDRNGRMVAPMMVAPHHQHFFNVRLDFDIDGPGNSVAEYNVVAEPAERNPAGNAFHATVDVFQSERGAMRDLNMATSRRWKIFNPGVLTALGHNPGYTLVPGENTIPYGAPDNATRVRAGFLEHHLHVTAHREGELNASGAYPNQSRVSTGLPGWCADDEAIADRDLVLWYTFGTTHLAHPEEWPIMNASRIGFKLVPNGFFEENPALDLPATTHERP